MAETDVDSRPLYKIRASTLKNRKRRTASPELWREFEMTIPKGSGVSQMARVRVFRSRMHTMEQCRFIIHCAFPLTTESQAFSVLQLMKMQAEVRFAKHHCQAYILKSGQYCTDDGVSKLGALIKSVMTEVRATGVACIVSLFSFGSRKKFRIGRILSSVQRLLQEAGRKGFVMTKHKWGVGRSLGGISAPPCKLRTVTLSSIKKRMPCSKLHARSRAPIKESIVLSSNCTKRAVPIIDPVSSTSSNRDKFWPAPKRVKVSSSVHIKQDSENFTNGFSDPILRSVFPKRMIFSSKTSSTPFKSKLKAEILGDLNTFVPLSSHQPESENLDVKPVFNHNSDVYAAENLKLRNQLLFITKKSKESQRSESSEQGFKVIIGNGTTCAKAVSSCIKPRALPVIPKSEEPAAMIDESFFDEAMLSGEISKSLPYSRKPEPAVLKLGSSTEGTLHSNRNNSRLNFPLTFFSSATNARSIRFHEKRHSKLLQNDHTYYNNADISSGIAFDSFQKDKDSEVKSHSSVTSSCVLIETREGSRSIRFLPVRRATQGSLFRFKRMKR